MNNIFNSDFRDFLQSLNNNDVEYILIGGYVVIIYGHARTTGNMDLWVNGTESNQLYKMLGASAPRKTNH